MENCSLPSLEPVLFLENRDGVGNLRVAARTFLACVLSAAGPVVEPAAPYLPEGLGRQID